MGKMLILTIVEAVLKWHWESADEKTEEINRYLYDKLKQLFFRGLSFRLIDESLVNGFKQTRLQMQI